MKCDVGLTFDLGGDGVDEGVDWEQSTADDYADEASHDNHEDWLNHS